MGIAYDYSMAVVLAVLGLLSVATLILGVVGVVTGRSYAPTVIWRLRRRRTPASAEDERLLGMSITLYAVFGLLMTVQSGALAIVISTGLRSPRTPAFELATLIGLLVVFCVDLLLIGAAAAIGFRVRYVVGRPNRLSPEADPGAQST